MLIDANANSALMHILPISLRYKAAGYWGIERFPYLN